MKKDPTLMRIFGDDYLERLIAYGESEPQNLDGAYIFDAVMITPLREKKNWTVWYKESTSPLAVRVGVPIKVIFNELN